MKLSKIVAAAALFAVVLSTPVFAAKKASKAKTKVEVEDYPGIALGAEIPDWVKTALTGDKRSVAKQLKLDDSEYQIFFFTAEGDDLDFLKTWSDNVDVRAEVANSFSQAVGQAVDATYKGTSDGKNSEKERLINQTTKTLSTMQISGLLKEAQFWIEYRKPKAGVKITKKSTEDDYDYYYEYYVVYSMKRNIYDKQVDAVLKEIDDFGSETEALKKALAANLKAPLVNKAQDDTVEYDFDDEE